MLSKKDFWDQKISEWEKSKYKKRIKYFDFNSSVKFRRQIAVHVLDQISEEKRLLELGCGSGLLWERLKLSNIKSYKGVDFAKNAIEDFAKKIQNSKKYSLSCEDCIENSYPADIVVSLGLLDWVSIEKIKKLSENYKECWYLHSFSEKRQSLDQFIHRLYARLNYKVWTPCYRSADELIAVFGVNAKIYRHPKLSFGAFIHNLPSYVNFHME